MPDVIEIDQARTGERHKGIYFGVNSLLGKLTSPPGAATSGWAFKLNGYAPNAVQTEHVLFGIVSSLLSFR